MAKKVAIEIDIQGTKDVLDLQKAIKETNKELKNTDRSTEAYDDLVKKLVQLKAQLKDARKSQRQAVEAFRATDESIGAYSRLSAQLNVARQRLKDLQAAGTTTGAEVEELTEEVGRLDSTLKEIDRSVGQTAREVGDYEKAVRKAVGITEEQAGAFQRLEGRAKVLRRAYRDVATAQGANTEEAKKLQKELRKVEKQLKDVSGQAQRSGRRIGGLRTQLRGLGPAFEGIAAGFFVFLEIPAIIEDVTAAFNFAKNAIFEYTQRNNEAFQTQKLFNEQIDRAADGFFKEREQVKALFKPLQDDNISRDKKNEIIGKINDQYGEYLPNLLSDKSSNEDIAKALNSVNEALARKFALQAQDQKIAEISRKIAEEEVKFQQNLAKNLAIVSDRTLERARERGLTQEEFEEERTRKLRVGTDRRIKALQDELKAVTTTTDNVAKALVEAGLGVDQALQGIEGDAAKSQAEIAAAAAAARKKELDAQRAAAKKRSEERKKEQEQLLKQQEAFLRQEQTNAKSRADLLLRLQQETAKQLLDNQADSEAKALAQEASANGKRIAQLKAQEQSFVQALDEREKKITELFGEGSKEVLKFSETAAKQRILIAERTSAAIEAEDQRSLKKRGEIREQFATKELEERKKELQAFIAQLAEQRQEIVSATNLELLQVREARAKGFIDQQQADQQNFELRKKSLKDQLTQLRGEEFALVSQQEFGAEVAQEEFDKIVEARQQLNTELAELEEAQTRKVIEEAEKREAQQLKGIQQAFSAVSEGLSLVEGFSDALNEREQARLQSQADERQQRIEQLNQELSESSGLQKKFIQQRINDETQAAEQIAAAQERARKEQAIAQKAIAIGQAIINGALAVTAVLAQTTDPTPVQAFRFAAVAATIATTAAQVATIAAQPIAARGGVEGETFGRGGMVYGRSHANGGEKFAVGGRVVELEGGEAVINKRSTAMFRDQLSAINVAGGGKKFQTGGIVSPPMGAPAATSIGRGSAEVTALIVKNAELIQAVNGRIDRLEVIYTTNTEQAIQRDKQDRKEIRTRSTL
jgi:hypothetical protein